jgi:hypothetical protein
VRRLRLWRRAPKAQPLTASEPDALMLLEYRLAEHMVMQFMESLCEPPTLSRDRGGAGGAR